MGSFKAALNCFLLTMDYIGYYFDDGASKRGKTRFAQVGQLQ